MRDASSAPPDSMRLDLWLDVSCLFRTRSEAQKACALGRITINDQPAKSHRLLRVGDALAIARPFGRRQQILVRALAERHIKKEDARQLYVDRTPAPTPDEIERRRFERVARAAAAASRAPDKRERRARREFRGKA